MIASTGRTSEVIDVLLTSYVYAKLPRSFCPFDTLCILHFFLPTSLPILFFMSLTSSLSRPFLHSSSPSFPVNPPPSNTVPSLSVHPPPSFPFSVSTSHLFIIPCLCLHRLLVDGQRTLHEHSRSRPDVDIWIVCLDLR